MALHGERQPDGSFTIYTEKEWEEKNAAGASGAGYVWLLIPAVVAAIPFLRVEAQAHLPDPSVAPVPVLGIVTFSAPCRVRSRPSTRAPVIARVRVDEPYELLAERGRWLRLRSPSEPSLAGWAGCEDRAIGDSGEVLSDPADRARHDARSVRFPAGCRVRLGPSLEAPIVGQAQARIEYVVSSRDGRWLRIRAGQADDWSVGWSGCRDGILARNET